MSATAGVNANVTVVDDMPDGVLRLRVAGLGLKPEFLLVVELPRLHKHICNRM